MFPFKKKKKTCQVVSNVMATERESWDLYFVTLAQKVNGCLYISVGVIDFCAKVTMFEG